MWKISSIEVGDLVTYNNIFCIVIAISGSNKLRLKLLMKDDIEWHPAMFCKKSKKG